MRFPTIWYVRPAKAQTTWSARSCLYDSAIKPLHATEKKIRTENKVDV